jgi:UDPglucose 6-dehydrogenase
MKIVVFGLWHLGSVTAACLAELGHSVVGYDESEEFVRTLQLGVSPVSEPGLNELLSQNLSAGRLKFVSQLDNESPYDVLWVTIDTPVDESDRGQVEFVTNQITRAIMDAPQDCRVIISSQLPAGTTQKIRSTLKEHLIQKSISICYSPENLRLGSAIKVFMDPDRIVVGVNSENDRKLVEPLFASITDRIEWMSTVSAEMTKHAINAFLAISVVFANEIATLAEFEGANANDIARGLRSDARIGPKAYVLPGDSFAGGTLARDIRYLEDKSQTNDHPLALISSVVPSNDAHANWAQHKINQLIGDVKGKTVTICGLAYKVGTNTLRRSSAVSLGDWLLGNGAILRVIDNEDVPMPSQWDGRASRLESVNDSLKDSDVFVVGAGFVLQDTNIDFKHLSRSNSPLLVLDAGRRWPSLELIENVEYVFVGKERNPNE